MNEYFLCLTLNIRYKPRVINVSVIIKAIAVPFAEYNLANTMFSKIFKKEPSTKIII